LSPGDCTELEKLRADFPAWEFSAVSRRWGAEKRLEDGLIAIEKPDPQSLRRRVEFYEHPSDAGSQPAPS
jgi:hypothetical protein